MDIKSTSITGITSVRDSDDAVSKQYVDNRTVPSIVGNEGEFLYTDGDSVSWEPLSSYSEYTTAGSYTFNVPAYAKEFLIEATGAGGGGASGNTDGSSYVGDASIWIVRTAVVGETISFLNGIYISTNISGNLSTSEDGITWISRTSGSAITSQTRFVFGNNIYVAAGNGIASSTDTIVWEARTSGVPRDFTHIVFANGTYLAGGGTSNSTSDLVSSTDSIHWTARTSGFGSDTIRSLRYLNGKYLASGGRINQTGQKIGTSTDSISWSIQTIPELENDVVKDFSYGNNIYVCGGYTKILTSTDANTWTSVSTLSIRSLVYYNGLFVVAGPSTSRILTSTNGTIWIVRTVNYSGDMGDITLGHDGFYAVSSTSSTLFVSPFTTTGFSGGSGGSGAYASWQISKDQIAGSTLSVTVGQGGTGGRMIEPTTWTLRTSGSTQQLNNSIYVNNNYVTVGDGGTIRTSTDTIVWTARTFGAFSSLRALTYVNNTYVTVGFNGTIGTSTDTIVWTARTSGVTNIFRDITYGNNIYVTVGDDAYITVSTDTIVWEARTSGIITTNDFYTISYGNNTYFAAGSNSLARISTDSVIWTPTTVVSGFIGIRASLYVNGIFLAAPFKNIKVSTDANVWESRTSGISPSIFINNFLYDNNRYVLVAGNGIISTSTDTIVWTSRNSNTTSELNALTYGNNFFVAGGAFGTITAAPNLQPTAATDGGASSVSWTGPNSTTYSVSVNGGGAASLPQGFPAGGSAGAAETGPDNFLQTSNGRAGVNGLVITTLPFAAETASESFQPTSGGGGAWNGNRFGGAGGSIYYYDNLATNSSVEFNGSQGPLISGLSYGGGGSGGGSQDITAHTWFLRTSSNLNSLRGSLYANNNYVTVGNVATIRTSTDTIVWEARTAGTTINLSALTFGNNTYVAAGSSGTILTSTDTIVWEARDSGVVDDLFDITYGNNVYITSGHSGTIAISTDTIVWTARTSGDTANIFRTLTFGNNTYVAAGDSGTIRTSTDTIVWEARISSTSSILLGSIFENNNYVVSGNDGTIRTSTDTIVWEARDSGVVDNLYGITYGNNTYVIGSTNGNVIKSTDTIVWELKITGIIFGNTILTTAYGNNLYFYGSIIGRIGVSYGLIAGKGGNGSRGGGGGGGGYMIDSTTNTELAGNGGNGGDGYVKISWV